ncbi:MAG: hypothetical protein V1822_02750 [Candidatus Micrarchaeota archaeon]
MFVMQVAGRRLPGLGRKWSDPVPEKEEYGKYERPYIADVMRAALEAKKFVGINWKALAAGAKFEFSFPNEDKHFEDWNKQVAQAFKDAIFAQCSKRGILLKPEQIGIKILSPAEYKDGLLEKYRAATADYNFSQLYKELGVFIDRSLSRQEKIGLIDSFVGCHTKDELYSWMEENFEKLDFPYKERQGSAVESVFADMRRSDRAGNIWKEGNDAKPAGREAAKPLVKKTKAVSAENKPSGGAKKEETIAGVEYGGKKAAKVGSDSTKAAEKSLESSLGKYEGDWDFKGAGTKAKEDADSNEFVEANKKFASGKVADEKEASGGIEPIYAGAEDEISKVQGTLGLARFLFVMPDSFKEDPDYRNCLMDDEGNALSNRLSLAIEAFAGGQPLAINLSAKVEGAKEKIEGLRWMLKSYFEKNGVSVKIGEIERASFSNVEVSAGEQQPGLYKFTISRE